ncbi:Uncharacterised protein r2_g929 [Pycnogonum litorale]
MKEEGRCKESISRWYHDRELGCVNFNYTGCGGNANRFETLQHCQKTCDDIMKKYRICRMEKDSGVCPTTGMNETKPSEMYHYDIEQRRCFNFTYSGCGGNDNKFETIEQCMHTCSKVTVRNITVPEKRIKEKDTDDKKDKDKDGDNSSNSFKFNVGMSFIAFLFSFHTKHLFLE